MLAPRTPSHNPGAAPPSNPAPLMCGTGETTTCSGGRCVARAGPLYVGAGTPLPRGEGHHSARQSDGRVGRADDFSLYDPSYARGRDAPPHAGGSTNLRSVWGGCAAGAVRVCRKYMNVVARVSGYYRAQGYMVCDSIESIRAHSDYCVCEPKLMSLSAFRWV